MKVLLKSKGHIISLHEGKTLVGRCKVYLTGDNACILGNFIIYKRFRGKGYGSVLLSQVISMGKNIMLWVRKDNIPAKSLYTKHGFKEIGDDDPGRVIMYRKIGCTSR